MTLTIVAARAITTRVPIEPATSAIVSWTTTDLMATLELTVHTTDGRSSLALPYVSFSPDKRMTHRGFDEVARIDDDVVRTDVPMVAIDVQTQAILRRVAVSTPTFPARPSTPAPLAPLELDVPPASQYLAEYPDERGWCAPACVAMLLRRLGHDMSVDEAATLVYDSAYRGTGVWPFDVAVAGPFACTGVVFHARDLHVAAALMHANIAFAASLAWSGGALPGAAIAESRGHLVVVRGFDAHDDVIVNDPAQPAVRTVYPRAAFEAAWFEHGGVAFAIVPHPQVRALIDAVNA